MKKIFVMVCIVCLLIPMVLTVNAATETTMLYSVLENATEYNGNYYLVITGAYTWNQAKLYCEGIGGHLATITTQEENDFGYELWRASGASACWLGGTDEKVEAIWNWVTSEEWDYFDFAAGEPNGGTGENYVCYFRNNVTEGRWCDVNGSGQYAFMCEWEAKDIDYVRSTYGYLTSNNVLYNNAFYYNGNIYKVFNYAMTSTEAKEYCENIGGYMASITSAEEDKAVFSYICKEGNFHCMLGGSDESSEGHWVWASGEDFSYSNWGSGEPNNANNEDYIHYNLSSGEWNDIGWKNVFLCEWEDRCILSDGSVSNHTFGDSSVAEAPTCTSLGKTQKTCTRCGSIVTETVDMLEHEFGETVVVREVSCQMEGVTEKSCIHCGLKETTRLAKLDHDFGEMERISGSVLIPPIVEKQFCSMCGISIGTEDWSYIWVPLVIVAGVIFVTFGTINYIRILKKSKKP